MTIFPEKIQWLYHLHWFSVEVKNKQLPHSEATRWCHLHHETHKNTQCHGIAHTDLLFTTGTLPDKVLYTGFTFTDAKTGLQGF